MDAQSAVPKAGATVEEKFAAQTPSRPSTAKKSAPLKDFEFTFRRESTVELSTEAQKMMAESREEARKLRERMMAELPAVPTQVSGEEKSEAVNAEGALSSRKMAQAKGKSGRYSAAHMAEFKKMDSITNHPSAWRTDPSRFKNTNIVSTSNLSSLSRNTSKTNIALPDSKDLAVKPIMKPLPAPPQPSTALKRSPSKAELDKNEDSPFITRSVSRPLSAGSSIPGPAKRVKLSHDNDTSTSKPQNATSHIPISTPKSIGSRVAVDRPKGLSHLMTPTKSSLARANSVQSLKTTRLPVSSLMRSKSAKVASKFRNVLSGNNTTTQPTVKPSSEPVETNGPHTPTGQVAEPVKKPVSPTPIKVAVAIQDEAIVAPEELIASTPVPEQSLVSKLKSCLRTPHRLYSDDPLKVAAGTHLATPPQMRRAFELTAPKTAPVQKRVDFTSSTKEKAIRDEIRAASVEPTQPNNVLYPQLPVSSDDEDDHRRSTISELPIPGAFTFRAPSPLKFTPLPNTHSTIRQVRTSDVSPRRQTFGITSITSSTPLASATKRKRSDSLSRITEENELSDKENRIISPQQDDKQDEDGDGRPLKKARRIEGSFTPSIAISAPSPQKVDSLAKTLAHNKRMSSAVQKSPVKRGGGGLSAARLSMLAQPKKRA